jgi:hypothetical protein
VQEQKPANTRLAGADTPATLEHPISTQKSIDRSNPPSFQHKSHSTLHLDPITSRPRPNHQTLRSPRNSRMPSKKPRNHTTKAIQTAGEESAARDLCRCPAYVFRRQRSDRSIVWLRADQPLAPPEAFVLRQGLASLAEIT